MALLPAFLKIDVAWQIPGIAEGPPEELVLWAFGRQEAAEVSIRKV